jgi:hypothetical protein
MAADSQALSLEPGAWGPDADRWLSATGNAGDLADYRTQHDSGAARLFYVRHQGETVGAFLLRVDHCATGSEGVIVAAAMELEGVDMMASCLTAIESLFIGCARVRYHTSSPALARKMARHGYRPFEIVSMKEL